MKIDDLLGSTWTPYGVQCRNAEEAHILHKFLREAVLDRHICLHKVIGFTIQNAVRTERYKGNYIARNVQIGESYPQLVVNLLDKVFCNMTDNFALCPLDTGANTLNRTQFFDGRDKIYTVLFTNPDVATCLHGSSTIKVQLAYDSGYRSMAENSKQIANSFFPCYTDFSLGDYVRVLPLTPGSNSITIRYYNGMTSNLFRTILGEWSAYIRTGNIRKEDRLWLQSSYMH